MPTSPDSPITKRIGIAANPQLAFGRSVLRGAIGYIREKRPDIQADILTGEPPLSPRELASYDGFLDGTEELLLSDLAPDKPTVKVDEVLGSPHPLSLKLDHHAIGVVAAETLYARGVVCYGYFDGTREDNLRCVERSKARLAGFRQRLCELGVNDLDTRLHIHPPARFDLPSKWISDLPKPAGVFAYNDLGGLGVAEACRLENLSTPGDIALIGVDNDLLLCSLSQPWRSSINPGTETLAVHGIKMLLRQLETSSAPPTVGPSPVPAAVLRESTGQHSTQHPTVQAAITLIENRTSTEPHQAEQIAASVGVSLRSLEALFNEHIGTTIKQQILKARVEHFKFLLRTSDRSLDQIAAQLQQEPSNLRRLFTRIQGQSPSAYRDVFHDVPSASTRSSSPASRKTRSICFLSTLRGQAALDCLRGAEECARQFPDIVLSLRVDGFSCDGIDLPPAGETSFENYDGFIASTEVELPPEVAGKKPVIYFEHKRQHPLSWSIETDNWDLGVLAARHFLDKGHTRFAYCDYGSLIAPIGADSIDERSEQRYGGFIGTLKEAGIPTNTVMRGVFSGEENMGTWLRSLPRPTALFAFNDTLAISILRACRQAELRIPEDIALLGTDNDEFLGNMTHPSLSSVDSRFRHLGFESMTTMIAVLKDPLEIPQQALTILPRMVIERDSTRGIATQDPAMRAATDFITRHYPQPIRIQQVVEASGVSRRTLENRFRSTLGQSIAGFISATRVNAAADLLTSSALSVDEISAQVGIKHTQDFCALFKKLSGSSPLAFRRSRGQ